MKTDPISDSWDFLMGTQPDQTGLGALHWPLVGLFAILLLGSFANRADRLAAR